MNYHIRNLLPRPTLSGHGFSIMLSKEWKDRVAKSGLTQSEINAIVANRARLWLDSTGYDAIYDPDKTVDEKFDDRNKSKSERKYGPNARPMYDQHCIRVTWGEWGPEHITVPGDAAGLDLGSGLACPVGGMALYPHNVDNSCQALLLLIIFTELAEFINK